MAQGAAAAIPKASDQRRMIGRMTIAAEIPERRQSPPLPKINHTHSMPRSFA
jgi:hypothetical protein